MKIIRIALCVFVLMIVFCGVASAAKDTLVVADQYDATTMDSIENNMPTMRACSSIYDTLVFIKPDGSFIPGLAESWEFLSGTEYKFNLRHGVKFHNGDEMKASDVKYSFERAASEKGAGVRTYTQGIKEVEVVDDYTVIVRLKTVDYSFFTSLIHNWASILSEKATEAAGDSYSMNPVGTGPLKFVSWEKGNKYVLERFDDYWGNKVKYKRLEVRSIPEPTSRTIELETGGVDIAFPITTNDIKRIEENKNLALSRVPASTTTYLGFNNVKAPLDNVNVRKAIALALDIPTIQSAVWRGVGKVPTTLIPPAIRYSIQSEVGVPKQNVELAKKMLEEAGVKNAKLEIWTNERKERVDMATIIQAQLQDAGIESEIKVLEWGAFLNGLLEKKHDLFILGWATSVPDPNYALSGMLESDAANNYTFTFDKKLDELLAKGRSVPDGPERAAVYKDLQLYINETAPMLYLHIDESIGAMQKNVKGFVMDSSDNHSFRNAYFED